MTVDYEAEGRRTGRRTCMACTRDVYDAFDPHGVRVSVEPAPDRSKYRRYLLCMAQGTWYIRDPHPDEEGEDRPQWQLHDCPADRR